MPYRNLARPRAEIVAALENAARTLNANVTGSELVELAKHALRVLFHEEVYNPAQFSLPLQNVLAHAEYATYANNGGSMRALLLHAFSAIRNNGGHAMYSAVMLRSLMHISADQLKRSREILRKSNLADF